MRELVRRVNCWVPMYDTGPEMLTDVYRYHGGGVQMRTRVLGHTAFYPISWNRISVPHALRWNTSRNNYEMVRQQYNRSYAATFWTHSWGKPAWG